MTNASPQPASAKALLPLALFLILFLGTGLYFQSEGVEYAFYQLPSPVAILPAIVLGILLSKQAFEERIETFVGGVGDNNIITMCLIYLLAGAFSTVAEATGGVDAMVALGLNVIPASFLLPGLFIIAGVISTAMGTSMGTLAALAPVVLGIGEATDISLPLLAGVLVSGAMFGDNLSIISDTTIAATRTQCCTMRDKFRANLKIAIPAAIFTVIWLVTYDTSQVPLEIPEANLWLSLPYFIIIVLAVMGLNVFAVLGLGIVLAAAFGMFTVDYEWVAFSQDIYEGFGSMQEIFLLSLLIGGLSALIRQQGGLAFLAGFVESAANKVSKHKQRASAIGVAALTALTNLCVANNTVSILLAGEVSKRLAKVGNLAPRQSASLLDIFACVVQGALPYGAQALLMGASFKISPLSVSLHTGYCFILAAVAIAIIIWRRPLEDREPTPESA
ncbi:Na+/H+ antiporter NhaC family protein [uncultured Idiomarina sp.]|uniref:Na+/H+ antiporter NhaC family protein n=1 Tax=uncultured Idiomarina sp. TaxID=352961 RepID=UPI0025983139|nr:Na+/H+ antiporter NhaC family protein [uncultured Idiomarina sp.]